MAVQRSFPILLTRDLERLERFWRSAFGAERTYAYEDDGRVVYIAMLLGDSLLAIGLEPARTSDASNAALWLYVDDVDATFEHALEHGAEAVAPPEPMPWGERVAQVRDVDGTVVYLGAQAAGAPAAATGAEAAGTEREDTER